VKRCPTRSTSRRHGHPGVGSSNSSKGWQRVRVIGPGKLHDLIEGLNELQINILRWFGEEVCRL
jgi:hypothetical protein